MILRNFSYRLSSGSRDNSPRTKIIRRYARMHGFRHDGEKEEEDGRCYGRDELEEWGKGSGKR